MTWLESFTRSQKAVMLIILILFLIAGCGVPARPVAMPSATSLPAAIVPPLAMNPPAVPVVSTLAFIPTPLPTLTAEQEKVYVIDMLKTNGGCELPCWWGITPSSATLQTLRDQFSGAYKNGTLRQDGVTLFSGPNFEILNVDNLLDYRIDLGFGERDGIVQEIGVSAEANLAAQSRQFAQAWQRYSIDQVLTRYGMPSRVQLQLMPPIESGSQPNYTLTIVYDDKAFWISYEGPATYDATKAIMRMCPTFTDVYRINLRLQSPAVKASVFQPSPEEYDRSLEEETGMSLKAFYENFKNSSNQTCLEGSPTLP